MTPRKDADLLAVLAKGQAELFFQEVGRFPGSFIFDCLPQP
jgi:hypothetical protein